MKRVTPSPVRGCTHGPGHATQAGGTHQQLGVGADAEGVDGQLVAVQAEHELERVGVEHLHRVVLQRQGHLAAVLGRPLMRWCALWWLLGCPLRWTGWLRPSRGRESHSGKCT